IRDSSRWRAPRQEIQELLNQSLSAGEMDTRVAAALAASDRATRHVAGTMQAIDIAMRVVVDNLENADTTGFKAAIARVVDGKPEMSIDMTEGSLEATHSPLDVAIAGTGYFPVRISESDQRIGFTRAGNFTVNGQGSLIICIGDGCLLVPPITLPTS